MATDDDVRRIALGLPGAYEQASYDGAPSFRTKPRIFVRIRDDPRAVVLFLASEEEKHALIADNPRVYFTTPHYDGYPTVLARIEEIDVNELAEMIIESWRLRAPRRLVKEYDARTP